MDKLLRQWIMQAIKKNVSVLRIAIRQRAKFEGWLKFELAAIAETSGASSVVVETQSQEAGSNQRADISIIYDGVGYDIELKTPNTNWRLPGVVNTTRPITKNIAEIVSDGEKLRKSSKNGLVAFVMFPIPPDDTQWVKYIKRISDELQLPVTPQTNCDRLVLDIDQQHKAEVLICSFFVSKITGVSQLASE